MIQFPNMTDHLAALGELDEMLRRHGVEYWLFGGWAVDFHAGRVTRVHGDIDAAIWAEDYRRLTPLFIGRGWEHRPEAGEDGSTCYVRDTVRLELAFLARGAAGRTYTPLSDGQGKWPDGAFGDEVAELLGVRVRVIGRDALIADKSIVRPDSVTAAKDRADVANLTGKLGRSRSMTAGRNFKQNIKKY